MATVGSIAVKNVELFYSWIKQFGSSRIFLGADVKNELIAISGWLETTELHILDFLRGALHNGLTQAFCTDVSKDGMLEGPSIDLYKKIIETFPQLELVASGGVAKLNDIENLGLTGCSGVIIGKAIYENRISMNELENYLKHVN
jgi:phosphoribosylformimino-5-aminoimidazole carboxamide ribotide isomerase